MAGRPTKNPIESAASWTAFEPPAASAPVGLSLRFGRTCQALDPGSSGGPIAMFVAAASATASNPGPGTNAIAEHASSPFGLNLDVMPVLGTSSTATPSA